MKNTQLAESRFRDRSMRRGYGNDMWAHSLGTENADNTDAVTRFVLVVRSGQMMTRTAMIEPLLSSFLDWSSGYLAGNACNISLSGKLMCRELSPVLRRTASMSAAALPIPSAMSRTRGWLMR